MNKCLCDGQSYTLIDKKSDIYGTGTAFNYLEVTYKAPFLYIDADLYSEESLYTKIKLNYCLFCGRKLK